MFRPVSHHLRIVVVAALLSPACVKRLPPAPTPEPVAPQMPALPPPAGGHGRLVVDVVDGPVAVHRVDMAAEQVADSSGRVKYRFVESPAVLCAAAPCVSDVPTGNVLLGFPVLGDPDATEVELVHVGPEPSVYRRTLSVYDGRTGSVRVLGIIATALGGTAMMTGSALLPIGLARDVDGLTIAGGISLGAGVALLVAGIWAMNADAPTYRPGSSNHFPLP